MIHWTKTGQTTTQKVVFKPTNDSLEKIIPRTILLAEDKFEIPVCRDDQEVHVTSLSLNICQQKPFNVHQ